LAQSDGLTRREIERTVNLRSGQIEKVLKFLSVDSPAPLIQDDGRWRRTPIAYALDHAHIQRLTQQRESEWQQVLEYIDTSECLMALLARALDDERVERCGKCANCLGHPVVAAEYAHATSVEAARYRQAEFPLECRRQVAPGAFETYGFTGNLRADMRAETKVLSVWGDAGWGHIVRATSTLAASETTWPMPSQKWCVADGVQFPRLPGLRAYLHFSTLTLCPISRVP
jgi:ATP-dependent DNA helicase RecQ